MGGDRHLDINNSVERFLKHFQSLSCLPLVTDSEMSLLFGEEIVSTLSELDLYNQAEQHCLNCTRRCCVLVNCELYSPELSRCPVHDFRPALCRMHFCSKFTGEYKYLVKDIGDIFLESLLAGAKINNKVADYFDSPALVPLMPALVDSIRPLLERVKAGSLSEPIAWKVIRTEIEKYSLMDKNLLPLRGA